MPDISVGLNCPACGGALSVAEGENTVICQYCNSTLYVEGDQGVTTIAFKNKILKDGAAGASHSWWAKMPKARDLKSTGKIVESYPIYLPFWRTVTRVAGWICGYEEHRRTDKDGHVTVERVYLERIVNNDYVFSEIACDPGDLGIRSLKNFMGETSFADFDMIPTYEATTSKDDAIAKAKANALATARSSAHVPNVTFEKIHVIPKRLSMIYYPIWVVRYNYKDRMYFDSVDGVTGQVLSGRAPGDPMFQALAATAGASVGGLIAAAGIIFSNGAAEIAAIGVVVGFVVLYIAYRWFRHGSEVIQGDFKEKKSLASALSQVRQVSKSLEGLR